MKKHHPQLPTLLESLESRTLLSADLVPATVRYTAATYGPGDSIAANIQVANSGDVTVGSTFTVAAYLSLDTTLDSGDLLLRAKVFDDGLEAGETEGALGGLHIPANAPDGTYHLIVKVDTTNAVSEGNESNNIYVSPANIIVSASSPNGHGHTAHQRFVAQLYHDVLNREADDAGEREWVKRLDNGQETEASVSSKFINSQEYRDARVQALYRDYLGRSAETSGLRYWSDNVLAKGGTEDDVKTSILGSEEFAAKQGNDDTKLVQAYYQLLLRRSADAGGEDYFTRALRNGARRSDVAKEILSSLEFKEKKVEQAYTSLLRRTPDAGGKKYFVDRLKAGERQEDLEAELLRSEEYRENVT